MASLSLVKLLAFLALTLFTAWTLEPHIQKIVSHSSGLVKCLQDASVPVVLPAHELYEAHKTTFNTRLKHAPAAVAIPDTTAHVSSAVVCASTHNIKVQARGGGHSYGAFSAGGRDGSLIISMEKFQNVTVDSKNVAKVGSGLRLGNMATTLLNEYGRALPHGSCPGVGIGGHATHGGYGWPSRHWGLAMDRIIGMDVVLADGSVVHATEVNTPDLFFALRGAAESFGIVTTFHLQTYPAPDAVVFWSYDFGTEVLSNSGHLAADMTEHIQKFAQNDSVVDSRIGFGIYIEPAAYVWSGVFFGEQDEFETSVKPEMLRTLPLARETVETVDWGNFIAIIANQTVSVNNGPSYDQYSNFFATSIVSQESHPVTHDAWLSYFEYMIANGNLGEGTAWFSIIDHFGGPGSKINAIPAEATSFSHRDALFDFQHYGYIHDIKASFPPHIQPFVEGLNNAIPAAMPDVEFKGYSNYVDPTLTAEQARDFYYSKETYERLQAVKRQVDPGSVFWNPQAVEV